MAWEGERAKECRIENSMGLKPGCIRGTNSIPPSPLPCAMLLRVWTLLSILSFGSILSALEEFVGSIMTNMDKFDTQNVATRCYI